MQVPIKIRPPLHLAFRAKLERLVVLGQQAALHANLDLFQLRMQAAVRNVALVGICQIRAEQPACRAPRVPMRTHWAQAAVLPVLRELLQLRAVRPVRSVILDTMLRRINLPVLPVLRVLFRRRPFQPAVSSVVPELFRPLRVALFARHA